MAPRDAVEAAANSLLEACRVATDKNDEYHEAIGTDDMRGTRLARLRAYAARDTAQLRAERLLGREVCESLMAAYLSGVIN